MQDRPVKAANNFKPEPLPYALGLEIHFERGEEVRTEISAKFTPDRLNADYEASGLELAEWFTDERGFFALSLATKA